MKQKKPEKEKKRKKDKKNQKRTRERQKKKKKKKEEDKRPQLAPLPHRSHAYLYRHSGPRSSLCLGIAHRSASSELHHVNTQIKTFLAYGSLNLHLEDKVDLKGWGMIQPHHHRGLRLGGATTNSARRSTRSRQRGHHHEEDAAVVAPRSKEEGLKNPNEEDEVKKEEKRRNPKSRGHRRKTKKGGSHQPHAFHRESTSTRWTNGSQPRVSPSETLEARRAWVDPTAEGTQCASATCLPMRTLMNELTRWATA